MTTTKKKEENGNAVVIRKALKKNGMYKDALEPQIISLATAMRTLEMANKDISELTETYVWEETRYGQKIAPHPVFKIAKDAQELVTRQMKALHLTIDELAGGTEDDPLADLTKKLMKRKREAVVLTPDEGAKEESDE